MRLTVIPLIIALSFAPFMPLLEDFIASELQFAILLAGLIVADTILGTWVAYKNKNVKSKKMWGVLIKVALYIVALGCLHNMDKILELKSGEIPLMVDVMNYFDAVAYIYIASREILSINENFAKLGFRFLPVSITKRLEAFDDETGTPLEVK